MNDKSKRPWGGGDEGGKDEGPPNPWTLPPAGKRGKPTALDEWIKRARVGGGGGNGGGHFSLPGGPGGRSLWLIGVGLVVVVWIAVTSFHPIGPEERGVVTFFGRYSRTLGPGIHMTFPAPINRVDAIDVQNIRNEDFPDGGGENLMLTGDQNIIDLAYSVRWNVANAQDFAFQIKDPRSTVRATAESAMREVIANVDLDDAMGRGRTTIEAKVQQRMQQILDTYRAGVLIQGVAIKQADPPSQVNDAFKDVTAAQRDAVAAKNNAQAYAQQVIAQAEGEAGQFDRLYEQYKLAPEVTKRRMYYETMENILARTDKVIVDSPGVMPYLKLQGGRAMPPPPDDGSTVQSSAPAPSGNGQ
ncbi:MAG TPA: protease modulator HflK [Sphingomonas sp.]|nr:protease modulator HflK [Sphingomonas sp.]